MNMNLIQKSLGPHVRLNIMSILWVIIAALFSQSVSANQGGQFVLEKVFFGEASPHNTPLSWDVAENGYIVSFSSVYRSNCVGSYRVQFQFDRDIRTLQNGSQFEIFMRKLTGKTPCGFKKSSAMVVGPGNIRTQISPEFPSTYEYNGNIEVSGNRIVMHDGGANQQAVTVRTEIKKTTPHTAFALSVSGPNRRISYLVFLYRYETVATNPSSSFFQEGVNLPGSDYRSFFQSQADPKICQAACMDEGRCRAWTWVAPGIQGSQSKCWLKHSIPTATKSDCCTSGTKLVK